MNHLGRDRDEASPSCGTPHRPHLPSPVTASCPLNTVSVKGSSSATDTEDGIRMAAYSYTSFCVCIDPVIETILSVRGVTSYTTAARSR